MRQITVHQLNDDLVISLHKLPGFFKLGTCCIYNDGDQVTGRVGLWYSGTFFLQKERDRQWHLDYASLTQQARRLANNYAIKQGIGTVAKRFSPSQRVNNLLETIKQEGSACEA